MALVRGKGQRIRIPNLQVLIQMPAPMIQSAAGKKCHDNAVKASLKETLMDYWRGKWRDHFRQDARGRYDYKERAASYKKIKRKEMKSSRDLVYRGKTELTTTHTIPSFSIARGDVGGYKRQGAKTSSPFGVTGVLTTRMGFQGDSKPPSQRKPGGKGNPRTAKMAQRSDGKKKITPQDMATELGTWSDLEVSLAKLEFQSKYTEKLRAAIMSAPRWRARYLAQFNATYGL